MPHGQDICKLLYIVSFHSLLTGLKEHSPISVLLPSLGLQGRKCDYQELCARFKETLGLPGKNQCIAHFYLGSNYWESPNQQKNKMKHFPKKAVFCLDFKTQNLTQILWVEIVMCSIAIKWKFCFFWSILKGALVPLILKIVCHILSSIIQWILM